MEKLHNRNETSEGLVCSDNDVDIHYYVTRVDFITEGCNIMTVLD